MVLLRPIYFISVVSVCFGSIQFVWFSTIEFDHHKYNLYRVCHECSEGPSNPVRVLSTVNRDEEDEYETDGDVDLHRVRHVHALAQSQETADRVHHRFPPVKKGQK